jgi:hypothetical protein
MGCDVGIPVHPRRERYTGGYDSGNDDLLCEEWGKKDEKKDRKDL